MSRSHFPRNLFLASIGVLAMMSLAACNQQSTTSAQFIPSMTVPGPGLVKMVQKSHSGSRIVVDVLIFGPEPNLDLFAFKFGIRIADPSLVKFAAQSAYPQNALVADTGQTILMNVDGSSDRSLVQVDVEKQGGGAGNGFAGASAVVIELPFDVQGSGTTTLTITGLGANLPQALGSTRTPIAAVTFDTASASVRGVTTGGGGY